MGLKRGGRVLAEFCLAWMLMLGALAVMGTWAGAQTAPAIATTLVSDTVYKADGTVATGTVLVSWPAFTTAAGSSVPAGSTSVTIGAAGAFSVHLVPNAGSTPMGSYYTVVYHLGDGSVTREYWVVPVSVGTVMVSSIRSTVLPTSVAMQTVSKSYVDTAIAAAVTGHPLDSSPYVIKSGDTMTGPLVLPADPVSPLEASDKHYVDTQTAAVSSGLGQKVSLVPQTTQTVAQPVGTELAVNMLNGTEYASQYATGAGNNGIANATAGADCANGCEVTVEHNYTSGEVAAPTTWNDGTHVDDHRGGQRFESYFNPAAIHTQGENDAETIEVYSTQSAQAVSTATGAQEVFSTGLKIDSQALAGGSNVFPSLIQGAVPYFKSTYSAMTLTGTNYTLGQHVLVNQQQDCYGVGDCLMGGLAMRASGGFRDDADEGSHPYDRLFTEDPRVFTGTCSQGCNPGSTVVQVAATANAGTEGEGRYLIDTNPAKVITTGTLIGGIPNGGRQPSANFAGTSFPVSVFLESVQTIPTQAHSISPGTVTVPIATGGAPAGFATSTAALPSASGVACVTDVASSDGRPLNFETAAYTIVDGSHLRITFVRPHASGATIAVGGLCGYGLEQTVDTVAGIRQVFPVVGSTSATSLLYAGGLSAIVGVQGLTSAYVNANLIIASIARSGNVVSITTSTALPVDVNGLTLTVQGVTDSSYNGSFVVTTTGPNSLTYAENGPDSSTTGGTISLITGGFVLYPMAEVQNVFNAATKAVDGQLTLAANTVPWASGDAVEEPHYFQEWVSGDTDQLTQYTPRASRYQSAGYLYQGNNGPGLRGFTVQNATPASSYFGSGGTHTAPTIGVLVSGIWKTALDMQAGESAALQVHCNSHGCGNWNSAYDLIGMDSSAGQDRINFAPNTSTLNLNLRGTGYTFNPLGFTAGTINTTTLNAGTVHGLFSGTVTASSLPVFVSSGSGHQAGAVPDPGPTAGTTRYLREDGTWFTPTSAGVPSVNSLTGALSIVAGTNIAVTPSGSGITVATTPDSTGQTLTLSGSSGSYVGPLVVSGNGTNSMSFNLSNTSNNSQWQFLIPGSAGFPSTDAPFCFYNGATGIAECHRQDGLILQGSSKVGWGSGSLNGFTPDSYETSISHPSAGTVSLDTGGGTGNAVLITGKLSVNGVIQGNVAAPSGSCSAADKGWVFSQDGHATFCNGTSWISKL